MDFHTCCRQLDVARSKAAAGSFLWSTEPDCASGTKRATCGAASECQDNLPGPLLVRPHLTHRRKSAQLPVEPTVTVMKADRRLQIDPSTECVADGKSAFDHLVRASTGGHCRRRALKLCVIRRSMQTLRARCRWVHHERMVVDAHPTLPVKRACEPLARGQPDQVSST